MTSAGTLPRLDDSMQLELLGVTSDTPFPERASAPGGRPVSRSRPVLTDHRTMAHLIEATTEIHTI